MTSRLSFVGRAFQVAGILVGLPALAAAFWFGVELWKSRRLPIPTDPGPSQATDPLLRAAEEANRAAVNAGRALGDLGDAVLTGLLLLAIGTIVAAVGLYWTGRALRRERLWALWVARGLLLAVTAIAALAFLILDGPYALATLLAVTGLSLVSLRFLRRVDD
jgi:hypothetical protein